MMSEVEIAMAQREARAWMTAHQDYGGLSVSGRLVFRRPAPIVRH
jgi:hypothetical protein